MEKNRDSNPYPPIKVEAKNPCYADMILSNVGGQNSEMSAIAMYLYCNFASDGYKDWTDTFRKIAVAEMHHYYIFGKTALLLGTDPRMWERCNKTLQYWTPAYISYPANTEEIVQFALTGEYEAIKKYRNQMKKIKDPYILANLERIIEDEEHHILILRKMLPEA